MRPGFSVPVATSAIFTSASTAAAIAAACDAATFPASGSGATIGEGEMLSTPLLRDFPDHFAYQPLPVEIRADEL